MNKKFWKVIGNILFYLILVMLVFISIISIKAKKNNEQPSVMGYKFFNVMTGSMEPTIMVGDLIVVKEIDAEDVKVEDVITFKSSNTNNVTTHRVMEVLNDGDISFITKGDANNVDDPMPVEDELLVGKVVYKLSNFGQAVSFVQNNLLVIIIALIGAVGIIAALLKKKNK